MTWRARGVGAALALAVGCAPVTSSPPSGSALSAPMNTCPQSSCANYVQAGASPTCNGGQCLVAATFSGLVLVVSLSEDSYYAPGQTFAIPYEHLFDPPPTETCVPAACTHLPSLGVVQGAYVVDPSTQVLLDWDLGNPGKSTALPVHVTYRPLWPPSGSASNAVYAETVGLPLGLVDGYVVVDSSGEHPPGPGQGVSIAFQANLQPGNYQVTVSPDPPFDQAFPPDVATMPVAVGTQTDEDNLTFDVTNYEQTTSPIVPTFDLSRVGGLVGWTAYLRDATTHGTLSTVATLGAHTSAVTLATNHHPPGGDALTNTQLVLAPPSGSTVPLPGYIVAPQGGVLDSAETVPALPPAVTVTGNVTDADGVTPVEADLFFESIAGATTPQGIYTAGPPLTLNTGNFEYTGQASARLDAVDSPSSYSVHLPPGEYQLTVRPLDTGHAVTVQTALLLAPSATPLTTNVVAALPRSVTGAAALADGRPLGGAAVEAVPAQCAQGNSPLCMPRASSTTTAADGSWALSLDPGGYVLRIEPADGTRFPWVTESLLVGPTDVVVPPVTVPAPVYAGMKLRDPYDNPIVSSVVRIFQVPAEGQAVEIGEAITDATGQFSMYLAPSSQ